MRSPSRRLQDIWFCDVNEVNDDIDLVKHYSVPVKRRLTVSATMGYVRGVSTGWELLYDRYINCYDRSFTPPEGTMCFVDIKPDLDSDGNLRQVEVPEYDLNGEPVLDEHGMPVMTKQYVTEPDYIIKRVLNTHKGIVARFVISKV